MRVATITHLFPNPSQSVLGIFVFHRVKAMSRFMDVEVIAPVGWLPWGMCGRPKVVPKLRMEDRLFIHHPHYFNPPLLKPLEPTLFFASVLPIFIYRHKQKPFNILDTHFGYPDAPAVWLLARIFCLPFIVTVRGEDVYGHPRYPLRRIQIKQSLKEASRVVCLSEVTLQCCVSLGVNPSKIVQIPNGVDGQVFKLIDKNAARQILGIPTKGTVILSAGWLIPRKGYHYVLQALPELRKKFPNIRYVIVGGDTTTGEYKRYLVSLAQKLGIEKILTFVDAQPQDRLALFMASADVFCLPSEKEGWGNVIAEALSCGVPVVAYDVGGVRQMVVDGVNGFIVTQKSLQAWVEAIIKCLENGWNRSQIRDTVAHLQWEEVGRRIAILMREVLSEDARKRGRATLP